MNQYSSDHPEAALYRPAGPANIPGYMKHARDAYLPLEQPPTPDWWDSRTPYIVATFIALGCMAFGICAWIWR